ncbi:MAG: hypothetical protein HY738_01040 [Bacteroidia bacterium]|nr:hypothetical protein [Bacteroidia bacterium]
MKTTYNFFQILLNDNLCFGYQGAFSDEITNRVIDLSEDNINLHEELSLMKNKVSFLMAECFQNIIRHGDFNKKGTVKTSTGFFLTRNVFGSFVIASANLIDNDEIPSLMEKLDKVNSLDKIELRALYLDILENEGISKKGGAGLGLVEMARKSGQKLKYSFVKVDDEHSYFYLQICLKKEEYKELPEIPIHVSQDFHREMNKNNILMIHKGNYSQETILPILKMIEDNMQSLSEPMLKKKRVYHILVEILQNISLHSLENEGIKQGVFMIGKKGDFYMISSGNYILNEKIQHLEKQLNEIIRLDSVSLKSLYIEKLKEENEELKHSSGLGLIDIARESSEKLKFKFFPVDNEKS